MLPENRQDLCWTFQSTCHTLDDLNQQLNTYMMHTTLHHTRRRHHHHTGSDLNRGLEAPTGNRADKVHPTPAPLHLLLGDNHILKRKGIGSKSTTRTPEHCKIKMKGKGTQRYT